MEKLSLFEITAVELALTKLFKQQYFSVCDIDNVLKVTGAVMPTRLRNALGAIHCVNYGDMPKEFRDELFANVIAGVSGDGFPGEIVLSKQRKALGIIS